MSRYLISVFGRHVFVIISISFIYTLFWIGIFIAFSNLFEENIELICVFFIFVYLILAQPLKNLSTGYFLKGDEVLHKDKSFRTLSDLDSIQSVEKSFPIIKIILKKLNIDYIDFKLLPSKHKVVRIFQNRVNKSKAAKKFPPNYVISEELQTYIKTVPWGENIKDYPEEFRSYLAKKGIYCIIPIIFRGILVGCLCCPQVLEQSQTTILEYIAQKLALLIHNDYLDEKIHLAKEVEHDFLLARRVESFLESQDNIYIFNYRSAKIKQGWYDKYFPVYYEIKAKQKGKPKEQEIQYMILCRPIKNLQKGALIRLCLVQGYFISLAECSQSLIQLANSLQGLIQDYDTDSDVQEIHLEGFILSLTSSQVRVHYFGKELSLVRDNKLIKLQNSRPLGAKHWNQFNIMRLRFQHEIKFYIRNYPLISIQRDASFSEAYTHSKPFRFPFSVWKKG